MEMSEVSEYNRRASAEKFSRGNEGETLDFLHEMEGTLGHGVLGRVGRFRRIDSSQLRGMSPWNTSVFPVSSY